MDIKQKIQNMQKEVDEGDFKGKSLKKKEIEAKIIALKKESEQMKKKEEVKTEGKIDLKYKISASEKVIDVIKLVPEAVKLYGEGVVNQKAKDENETITWEHLSIPEVTDLALSKMAEIQKNVIVKSRQIRELKWQKMTIEEVQKAEKQGILAGYDPDEGLGAVKE